MKYLVIAFLLMASTAFGEVITINCGKDKLTIDAQKIDTISPVNSEKYPAIMVTWGKHEKYLSCSSWQQETGEFWRVSNIMKYPSKHQRAIKMQEEK